MALDTSNSIFASVAKKARIKDVIEYELGASSVIKKGKDYVCLCPFHNDHSPSMQINVERNMFKCFVDGKGGDAITFVSEYEHISKIEALKKVCRICSIPLPEEIQGKQSKEDSFQQQYKKELEALLELKKFYQTYLQTTEGEFCREYLAKRKIDEAPVRHFSLGLAPQDPTLAIKALRKAGFEVSTLEKAGILSNAGSLSDRFSFRLMYPIEDEYGNLVGFSGRKLKEEDNLGKYINYPSTPLFNKSRILYHFAQAKQEARKVGHIYVVEGFNDVIAFHRANHDNCVASMGTALTKENVETLKKLNVEVRLCLDADEPGQTAMEECLPLLLNAGVNFRVVKKFKGAKDADEILANYYPNGKEELDKQISRLVDPFMFLLRRAMDKAGSKNELTDPVAINEFIKKASPYFQKLDDVSKSNDLNWLAKITHVERKTLENLLSSQMPLPKKEEEVADKNEYNHKPRFNGKKYSKTEAEPINMVIDDNLPQGNNHTVHIRACFDKVKSTIHGKMLSDDLVKNETEIVFVLTHSREGYRLFENKKIDFCYEPFRKYILLIDVIYRNNPSLQAFSEYEYQILLDFVANYEELNQKYLESKAEQEQKASNSDVPFDMDDEESISIEDENNQFKDLPQLKEFIKIPFDDDDLSLIETMVKNSSSSLDTVYDKSVLNKNLNIHKPLKGYYEALGICKRNELNLSAELSKYLIELKKLGVIIKKQK